MLHSGRPGPYLQTLDLAGEACQEKHASLLQTFVNYGHKSFITLTPGANVLKLFLSVIYGFLYIARMFVRLDCKSLSMTNTLAYYKSFITLGPGPRLIGYARIVKNIERTKSMKF